MEASIHGLSEAFGARWVFCALLALLGACDSAANDPDASARVDGGATVDGGARDASEPDSALAPACALTDATRVELASGMAALHHDGQTFVSFPDRAMGEAGAMFRYALYRASTPIETAADLSAAVVIATGIFNHSGQMYGHARFTEEGRVDETARMATTTSSGEPLPLGSGLWVATTPDNGCAYYAVIATDLTDDSVEDVQPGVNATTLPLAETVAAPLPVLQLGADDREGPYVANTRVTGTANLPLEIVLHGSNAAGGDPDDYGDLWQTFADPSTSYQDGTPSAFTVRETHDDDPTLVVQPRDTALTPAGRPLETHWFGYLATPEWGGSRAIYPFTWARVVGLAGWATAHYRADAERVYLRGGSMGAWGSAQIGLRNPDVFAAVYPDRPRFVMRTPPSMIGPIEASDRMATGEMWEPYGDLVALVRARPARLPFVGWNCGRNDGFASWQEQLDMVAALTEGHYGFAFAWNDGDHSGGSAASAEISRWYPRGRILLSESYPAFGRSSLDDDPGAGEPTDGDLVGGINLGFTWSELVDDANVWSARIANELATADFTVDVTPRNAQRFHPAPGDVVSYTIDGVAGTATAGPEGVVTLEAATIHAGAGSVVELHLP